MKADTKQTKEKKQTDKPPQEQKVTVLGRDVTILPKHKAIFMRYVAWKNIPTVLLGKPSEYYREIGIKEEVERELLNIETQREFAKLYKVNEGTLSTWNGKIQEAGLIEDWKEWGKSKTANINAAFYHQTLKHADAHRVRLWHELFEGKEGEGNTPAVFSPQLNQVIINLGTEYDSKLRKAYEEQIKGNVHSTE